MSNVNHSHLTDEQIDMALIDRDKTHGDTDESGNRAAAKAEKKASKKASKASAKDANTQVAEDETNTFEMLPADTNRHYARLSSLVPLDSTPIPNAKFAMRELNQENLVSVRSGIENGTLTEPLIVMPTTMGLVVIDGYHRWYTYVQLVRDTVAEHNPSFSEEEIDSTVSQVLPEYDVPVVERSYSSYREVLKASYEANLRHGLRASEKSRVRYAIQLIAWATEDGNNLSRRDAARMVGCSHSAITRQMLRDAEKGKMRDEMISEDGDIEEEEKAQSEKSTNFATAEKHIKAILAACAYFSNDEKSGFENIDEVIRFVQSYGKTTTYIAAVTLEIIATAIAQVAPNQNTATQKSLSQIEADNQERVATLN